jgi:hypothetical protein
VFSYLWWMPDFSRGGGQSVGTNALAFSATGEVGEVKAGDSRWQAKPLNRPSKLQISVWQAPPVTPFGRASEPPTRQRTARGHEGR